MIEDGASVIPHNEGWITVEGKWFNGVFIPRRPEGEYKGLEPLANNPTPLDEGV
jgi:hypothetical protein